MRKLPSGDEVAEARLATNELTVRGKVKTEWHRLVVGGELVASFKAYAKKGRLLHVEGSVRTREYVPKTGKNAGRKMDVTEVVVKRFQFMDAKPGPVPGREE